jgi:hypothetical protein
VLGGGGAWPQRPPYGRRLRTLGEFSDMLEFVRER